MVKICVDDIQYCRVVVKGGLRKTLVLKQLDDIMDEHTEDTLKKMAKISMGAAISDIYLDNIQSLAQKVIDLTESRNELSQQLQNASSIKTAPQGNKARFAKVLACKTSLSARIGNIAIEPESKDDDGNNDGQ